MTLRKTRTAILISGRGSNMQALVDAARADDYPAEIVLIASNRPDAPGLEWANARGLPTLAIDHKRYATREAFEDALQEALKAAGTELVALAGFMRLMTPAFVERWRDRMINIHPSLLPSFKGLHTHERVLAAGVRITGCTVHFVRAEMDDGPIIGQAAVPVLSGDDPDTLAARVLAAEHRLYPAGLKLVASGRIRRDGEKIVISQDINSSSPIYSPSL
ncbi:MAG TPA: phosphoribosylglycinamide formyltransferase [Hyphomicrobium sp.]|nr:phosphoribosylglycinamide formyltransferase [Hyphomicrobium sp.]